MNNKKMELNIEFKTNRNDADVKEKSKSYFAKNKFTLKSENGNTLVFVRGNALLNMITFNPLQWKSSTTITTEKGCVKLSSKISTTGQVVAAHEYKLWKDFVENYKKFILKNTNPVDDEALRKTKSENYKMMLEVILSVLVIGVIAKILKMIFY